MGSDGMYYISREIREYLLCEHGEGMTMDQMLRAEFGLQKQPKKKAIKKSRYKYYMADLAIGASRIFLFDDKESTTVDEAFKKWRAVYRSCVAQQKKHSMLFDLSWSSGGVRVTRMK